MVIYVVVNVVMSMTVARHAIFAGHRIRFISAYTSDVQIVVTMMNLKGGFDLSFAVRVVYSHVVTIFLPHKGKTSSYKCPLLFWGRTLPFCL